MQKRNWKRNIILFLSGQCLSMFGSSIVQYAVVWYITLKTQSGAMLTIGILTSMLPEFLMSPVGGVWADRYSRKILINLSDGFTALVALGMALLFHVGITSVWPLFVCMFLRALSGSVQSPAVSAIIPRLVPAEHLTRVNAINSSIQSAVNLVSPLLSGAILSLLGLGVTFFIDVITAAISIVIVFFFVHEPLPKPGESAKSDELHFFIDLREGLRYAGSHRFLKQLFIFTAFIMFCSVPMAFLAALQVSRDFGNDVWRLTALEFTYSVGELAGGVALSVWGGLKNRAHTMFIACLLMGASCAGMGLIPFFIPYLACMGVIGVSMPFYHTPVAVILQERIEDAYLGRVFGFFNTITCLTMPIGMMILGPLADKVNINYLFSACGAGMLMLGFFFILSKTIRAAGLPVQKPKL